MKITQSLLALAIAGLLGQTAFADNQFGPLGLAITSNGHGQQHFQYFQTSGNADLSVALYTSSAGGVIAPLGMQRTQADMGNTRLVLGNNQHALANAAYIPTSSHFAPAGQ